MLLAQGRHAGYLWSRYFIFTRTCPLWATLSTPQPPNSPLQFPSKKEKKKKKFNLHFSYSKKTGKAGAFPGSCLYCLPCLCSDIHRPPLPTLPGPSSPVMNVSPTWAASLLLGRQPPSPAAVYHPRPFRLPVSSNLILPAGQRETLSNA